MIYTILAVLATFLQLMANFILWPMIVVVIATQRLVDAKAVYLVAFLSGLVSDLVMGRFLGETAILLLLVAFGLHFLNLRFKKDWRLAAAGVIIGESIYLFITMNFGF